MQWLNATNRSLLNLEVTLKLSGDKRIKIDPFSKSGGQSIPQITELLSGVCTPWSLHSLESAPSGVSTVWSPHPLESGVLTLWGLHLREPQLSEVFTLWRLGVFACVSLHPGSLNSLESPLLGVSTLWGIHSLESSLQGVSTL